MHTETAIDIHSEHDAADLAACKLVNDILIQHYPGHPWMVGVNHKAGTVHIELPYQDRIRTRFPYGFLLHLSSLRSEAEARRKVVWAGGELLERYGLPRGRATSDAWNIAAEHGLDRSSPA